MASLECRSGQYRVVFRFGGQRFSRSLKTRNEVEARASLARLLDSLRRLELGLIQLPPAADLCTFLLSDGKATAKPQAPQVHTLEQLCENYFECLPCGSIEESTLHCMQMHVRHLKRVLGPSLPIGGLSFNDLQRYIELRSGQTGLRGRPISSTTIKKELTTLSTIWSWGGLSGAVQRPFPKKGLKFPKTLEKPRFQTWTEIARRINRGHLSDAEKADLWDCLFLTLPEIDELLRFVKDNARQPWIHPMFFFAAHTGARRSEMIRSSIDDVDLGARIVTIHERKRDHHRHTTRQVPISPSLSVVLEEWLGQHPGGGHLFCQLPEVSRSKKERSQPLPITRDEAHDHFKRTIAGSKWAVLRGWHVFRHSFCSNCAAKGIDQRIINAWVGHQTEDMVRRYRHLIPDQQQSAIMTVFGNGQQDVVAEPQ